MKRLFIACLLLLSQHVAAHFTHFEPRILHIYQDKSDILVLMRMPLPLVLLDASWKGIDAKNQVPYTKQAEMEDGIDYLLDRAALTEKPELLIEKISQGYRFEINQSLRSAQVEAIHLFNSDNRRSFVDIASAESNFDGFMLLEPEAIKFFDTGLDIKFRLQNASVIADNMTIFSKLGDQFNAINRLANVVNIYRNGQHLSNTTVGILELSSQRLPSAWERGISGFWQGMEHIFIGLDHVLFILLIFFTSNSIMRLITLATAFTIGHSFSLLVGDNLLISAGFFIPAIELLIALSIAVTAVALIMNKGHHLTSTPMLCIGFIHGFGFSFVFRELAEASGQGRDWLTLSTFTLGIEAGQLIIYLLAFGFAWCVNHYLSPKRSLAFYVSLFALAVSQYWVLTRMLPLLDAVI
ncbi:HupE/UreJ family protein [Neptuniibacter sp. CAU 1671]|uniref:HupE/UreJ family protein n=1 Tax=Neptuniibacter sp. CAU 1671 TaxID=3032593 RepID=UPI0023D9A1DC|nr:HupE/UreJ family protein [Neptuniibacter sp. CAU 1671]MDF2181952.1 HupE/UreJ family protein [Neptuniibacter sp. CAU 1671]